MTSQRNYRAWSEIEDAKLVESMVNMVNSGAFKAENGFKSGYLVHLESCLKECLPNAGILGKPHIESRIKTMKKDWQTVYDMLNGNNTSGFGFDYQKHCVTAEASVWDAYLQVHKEATKWRNKSFPFYDELCIVFGKDRAQGNRAADAVEMEEPVTDDSRAVDAEENFTENEEESNAYATMPSEDGTTPTRKRKKHGSNSLHEVINTATFVLGEKLTKASETMMAIDADMHQKTSLLISDVENMESLTQMEVFFALRKITHDPESVLTYWNLKNENREAWVRFMLDN